MIFISIRESRSERRQRFRKKGIPPDIRTKIRSLRRAQTTRLSNKFAKTKACLDMFTEIAENKKKLAKIVGEKEIVITLPLTSSTSKLLSRPGAKELVLKDTELHVRYHEMLLEFVEKQKGMYQSHIDFLEKKLEEAEHNQGVVERALKDL